MAPHALGCFTKERREILEEYLLICSSLMRWLKDSITTMDNKNVPNDLYEIKVTSQRPLASADFF